ncbi:hypothetical protein QMO56_22260 [Roseomonas sp. E05]|uniref:hypothetical protein n=1 Tax=Roseomonas sp. E05 TaxID=3046310 RepID=UPI0024BB217A|nr:hypothetical protein [Roseomonas sp. E05]MDJ0390844.1 hypothetical protein [Roseomonas sp. E05]
MSDDRRRRRAQACLAALLGMALLLPAGGARAQLRSLSVPAGAGVVVAPRGQAQPRLVRPPAALSDAAAEAPAPLQLPAGGQGLAAPLGLILPMAAGALLGVGVAGGGSGSSSGPVRTR